MYKRLVYVTHQSFIVVHSNIEQKTRREVKTEEKVEHMEQASQIDVQTPQQESEVTAAPANLDGQEEHHQPEVSSSNAGESSSDTGTSTPDTPAPTDETSAQPLGEARADPFFIS